MAGNSKDTPSKEVPPKRLNRAVGVGEALGRVIDPALRRRGFASRDLLTKWAALVPAPYDRVTLPDRLSWPRGTRGAEGATLYLRCAPGHGLAVQHDGQLISAAINRFFGYFLVSSVRLSAEPLGAPAPAGQPAQPPSPEVTARVETAVEDIADEGLRAALAGLGVGLSRAKRR